MRGRDVVSLRRRASFSRAAGRTGGGRLRFSVIIPSWNRPARLRQCLEAISRLEYPRTEFETIVVDDGSNPPLESIVTADAFADGFVLSFLRQRNSGPAQARNRGASAARGEWLVFIDDDCVPRPDWLQRMDEGAARYPGDLLGGAVHNGSPDNIFAEVNQNLVDSVKGWLLQSGSPIAFVPSNNLAIPRSAFETVGGFDGLFRYAAGEDRELCARWLAAGNTIRQVPDAGIDHHHPQNLRLFAGMHFRYGRGSALFHEIMKTSPAQHFAPGLYRHLIKPYWQGTQPAGHRLLGTGLLILSQAATAAGYFTAKFGRPGH